MAKLPPPIPPDIERELDGTPELALLKRRRTEELDALYPKPDATSIQRFYEREKSNDATWHEYIRNGREMRFMQDELPEKLKKRDKFGRRFRTRLSNNEVLRTVSLQCRNDYKVRIPASGSSDKAITRGTKQSRWCQQLRPAFERKASKPLRRIVVDNQHGDSIGAWEFYLTDAYDRVDLEQREDESAHDYNRRTEEQLKQAGMPFGIRPVDKLALFYREDEDGVCKAVIAERKPREDYEGEERLRALRKKRKDSGEDVGDIPDPHVAGEPIDAHSSENTGDTVECIRYYDRRWYAYMVDGKFVDGPHEHKLPDCPIFLIPGIPTGSPNKSEALQGVTWGLFDIERFLNDSLTREWDLAFRYMDPKVVIETAPGQQLLYDDPAQTRPTVLKLDGDGVSQLNPGQKIVNATQGWQPYDLGKVQGFALQMFERSGLNPIAQGESPGSDPAGYTVNSLQGAAQNLYEVLLDNEARAWEKVCDFARLTVRDTLREVVYLSVPMGDTREGGTEWLALAPDDVDETPAIVTIDPLSDANRLSIRQSLMEGNARGYVPRRLVQQDGFGIEDPRAADKELAVDTLMQQLMGQAVQEAMAIIAARQQPAQPSGLVGPDGVTPLSSGQANGGVPAPVQPPTVGAELSVASQAGSVPGVASRARGGQDSGYRPPQGVMSP